MLFKKKIIIHAIFDVLKKRFLKKGAERHRAPVIRPTPQIVQEGRMTAVCEQAVTVTGRGDFWENVTLNMSSLTDACFRDTS